MSGQRKDTLGEVDFEQQEKALLARAAKFRASTASAPNKVGIVNEVVDIYSDGVRMSGTVWTPADTPPGAKLPSLVLCHGWGGKRAHLDFSYAVKFAQAGFLVLTFDYRGWGDSDGNLVPAHGASGGNGGKRPAGQSNRAAQAADGTVAAREVRKIVDPEHQVRDCQSALDFLVGLPGVDATRVGLWGSSFGAGNALAVAARDPRVKVVVAQIGSIDTHANWVNRHPDFRGVQAIRALATAQAQGKIQPWTVRKPKGLDGSPNLPKVVFEQTNSTIGGLPKIRAATLILAAENEELFHNKNNSEFVYERLKGQVPVELDYLPGGHYDAYGQPAYGQGVAKALEWFQIYLGDPSIAPKGPATAKL